jgi:hypothetical protein
MRIEIFSSIFLFFILNHTLRTKKRHTVKFMTPRPHYLEMMHIIGRICPRYYTLTFLRISFFLLYETTLYLTKTKHAAKFVTLRLHLVERIVERSV